MNHPHREKGSALLVALAFMVLVLVLAAGVHSLVIGGLRGSGAQQQRVAAEYLAGGGVARAIGWFQSENYQLPAQKDLVDQVPVLLAASKRPLILPDNHPDGYVDTFGQKRADVVASFQKYLTQQSAPNGTYSVVASLIALQPETWEILAMGQSAGEQATVGALLTREQQALFTDALFGRTRVTMSGNAKTDSYDSSAGGYGSKNKFQTGHVRSNGSITLSGNATINGDAMPGPDGAVGTSGNAKVTGSTDPAKSMKSLPDAVIPAGAIDLGALKLSGNDAQPIKTGVYVADSLAISGNARLSVDSASGPVALYVKGEISIAGNGISNSSSVPRNLSIVQVGGAAVSISGNADLTATVYAPQSVLKLSGNGDYYGSFVGVEIAISGNGEFHFDEYLRTASTAPGPLRVMAQWTNPR